MKQYKKHSARYGQLLGLLTGIFIIALCWYLFFPPSSPPNVIFISVDTLRADHLSCYGWKRNTTPHLDAFAEKTAVFKNAYTPRSETAPALASALSGLYPSRHGVRTNDNALPDGVVTLAALLKKAGYHTKAVIANPVIRGSRLARDFEQSVFTSAKNEPQWRWDEKAVDEAVSFLSRPAGRPFFLWVHLMDPHSPYQAGPEHKGMFASPAAGLDGSRKQLIEITRSGEKLLEEDRAGIQALYDEEVRGSDNRIGRIFDVLEKFGSWADTAVVFFSDHGEELGDHHNYFFHSISVYRPAHHVPLLVYVPKHDDGEMAQAEKKGAEAHAGKGRVIDAPVTLVDLTPTILSLTKTTFPEAVKADGVSLAPLLRGGTLARDRVFTEYKDRINGVFTRQFHYISNPDGFTPHTGADGGFPGDGKTQTELRKRYGRLQRFTVEREELYELGADPLEKANKAKDEPELTGELKKSIDIHLENVQTPAAETISKEARGRIEELGY